MTPESGVGHRHARPNDLDGQVELARFVEEEVGALGHTLAPVVLARVARQHDHEGIRVLGPRVRNQTEPIFPAQVKVKHHDVERRSHRGDGLLPARRLGDGLHSGNFAEHFHEPRADRRRVFDDEHPHAKEGTRRCPARASAGYPVVCRTIEGAASGFVLRPHRSRAADPSASEPG